ncbi:MAG: IS3 family transposase [Nitrospira sp.]|nr:IS3 family transposase [Nitrospira sp.]
MSRRHCWDKRASRVSSGRSSELVYHRHYITRDEAMQEIFEYIEVFYNRQRRHSTLGYKSPAEYEARAAVA